MFPARMVPPSLRNRIAAVALAIGLAERLFWAFTRREPFATGEAENVAIALAQGRGFADAYFLGQGPTAHLLPASPAFAGLIYRLFGVHRPLAEAVLLGWSLALVFAAYALFARIAERLGAPGGAVLAAFVSLAVVPVYTTFETFDFRVWEGGMGLVLGAVLLLVLLTAEQGDAPRRLGWWLAALSAVLFFVHPSIGLAGFTALLWFLWRRGDWRFAARTLAGSALGLALLVGPWALRNQRVMGESILLRDNIGLEFAVANFPAMVHPDDPDRIFFDRLLAIHPYDHPKPYAAMWAAGGESAYARKMGRETFAWMRANPGDVTSIWLRHLREMLFTRTWMFHTSHGVWLPPFRATFVSILAVLGLLRMGIAAARGEGAYAYIGAFVMVPSLCYLPFQPIPRYTWLIYPPLAYLAFDMAAQILARTRRRRAAVLTLAEGGSTGPSSCEAVLARGR